MVRSKFTLRVTLATLTQVVLKVCRILAEFGVVLYVVVVSDRKFKA